MTRRQLIERLGMLGTLGAAAGIVRPKSAAAESGLRLGVCSYSFREFQRDLAIKMIQQLELQYVSVKSFHIPYTVTPSEAAQARAAFTKTGLTIVSGGVIDMQDDDLQFLRTRFDYARLCGMPMIIAAPTRRSLPAIEKLVAEYNTPVAIHNHGPEDKNFPSPRSVLEAVKGMDPRIGLCMDVGHAIRAGADVVEGVSEAGPRLLDIHFKDLRDPNDKNSWCDVGDGVMPVVRFFQALRQNNYKGCVNLEHELNPDNPLPGMLHSIGYMRGVLAALAATR